MTQTTVHELHSLHLKLLLGGLLGYVDIEAEEELGIAEGL